LKIIAVNNPAAKSGGALTILKQFIENVALKDQENLYYIFVTLEELKCYEKENIKIVVLTKIKGLKRLYWDYLGLKKWFSDKEILPNLIISLQNTGVNFRGIDQILYEHQSLIFYEGKEYFFYRKIYPFLIKALINKNTTIVVQSSWLKEKFEKLLKNKKYNKIIICPPLIELKEYKYVEESIDLKEEYINLFYPASSQELKNHSFLLALLKEMKRKTPELIEKLCIHCTIEKDDKKDFYEKVLKEGFEKNIIFTGKINYNRVINYYKKVDALIFPSLIESFPLPLIEATSLGLKVMVSDLPYSQYLNEYMGASLIPLDSKEKWIDEIKKVPFNKNKYEGALKLENGWEVLLKEIKK